MARRQLFICDLTGTDDAVPTTFSVGDQTWTADFSPTAMDKLMKALAPYIKVATLKESSYNGETQLMRAWAAQQGFDIAPKGRIPEHIQRAFYEAHPEPDEEPEGASTASTT